MDLVQGASTEIRVRVSRIEGSEVTVEIAAEHGIACGADLSDANGSGDTGRNDGDRGRGL